MGVRVKAVERDVMNYVPVPTGLLFHRARELIKGIRGPVGSGKSVACCIEIFTKSCGQVAHPDGVRRSKWLIYRKYKADLELTTLPTWLEWFPQTEMKYDDPMEGVYRCLHPSGDGTLVEMQLIFLGLDSPASVRKLKSLEISGAWGNEAPQVDWRIHSMVYQRTGRYPKKEGSLRFPRLGLLLDGNSPHESNWWRVRAEDVRDARGSTAGTATSVFPGARLMLSVMRMVPTRLIFTRTS